jgi:hypothetical protein
VGQNYSDDLSLIFGKNNLGRLRSTFKNIDASSVVHRIEPLTDEVLDWFTPLYLKTITNKDNPKLFDIRSTTIGKESKYKYYSLTLLEDNIPIGGTIFSERGPILSIAYRIYPNTWKQNNLQANPSVLAECLLNNHGVEHGFKTLSHGRDRNPYGLNAHIGLAIFKLSMGCSAYLPSTPYEIQTLDLNQVNQDVLLFKMPTEGDQITKGILYATEENLSNYMQVAKYPERLLVEIITRNPQ